MATITITDRPDSARYVLEVDGEQAGFLTYRLEPGLIRLTHAEVDPSLERHGLGSQLAAFALDDARERGLAVLPLCPFVKYYIGLHPEYGELVPEPTRGRLGL